ncbi:YggS family pyridoxal phosphate-dependent enzyme [Flagellimonas halotolerans]|uniref:Pyridoxal phosphate homeostasis protein n=1 Tax=Flagellimonas halotolerans TaxID=3112164 RepID=A0ABU6IUM4_9FLAO|nr:MULTISPECIES: YggS family pyridoxal phosphate-dependent enzyme [unclassified Allomuricauda]MEC3966956.1 YggS family pyridoxal phosphate-dependent enzyme [Muricauda sp. SYSU M86414]MEC4266819.1 YggS family pyridoxal phosphate-dependent enzyme [Muricauda sp. SYSU M84420]
MPIKDDLNKIKSELPEGVTLVAVSKTKPNEDILEAYEAGQRVFGENKVQEMVQKWEGLPKDIEWHMIGHVQRNKVKYMAEFVSLIHGVDSPRLLKEINKQAKKHDRVIPCLLQIHIAEEDTKFGLDEKELYELISSDYFKAMEHIKIVGLMGMATFTDDMNQVRREFAQLKSMFDSLKDKLTDISILSMGMSGDYAIAIEEGSTMVRIGSSIFGARNYS